jgi:hypothetical protein
MTCSRCNSTAPNPGCHVCAEPLADERCAFAAAKDGRFGDWHADDVGPDMDDFIKPACEEVTA